MNKLLKWALWYAEHMDWSIIPINPDSKKPLIKWKQFIKVAATAEEIEAWWKVKPDANIGLVCGHISNVTVIDIDEYEVPGTEDYLKQLYNEQRQDPNPPWNHTAVSRTGSGGKHWIFQHREGLISKRVIPAVDCKTDGGYVILPPSEIKGKRYSWINPPYDREGGYILTPSHFPVVFDSLYSEINPFMPMDGESVSPQSKSVGGQTKDCGTGVYVIEMNGYLKVGYANNIQRRLREHRSASPSHETAELVRAYPMSVEQERALHKSLTQHLAYGKEWYVSDGDILEIIDSKVRRIMEELPLQNGMEKGYRCSFDKGYRDESLFHIAYQLAKAGTPDEEIYAAVGQLADSCVPPFKGADEKVKSALARAGAGSFAEEIRMWIADIEGTFTYEQVDREFSITTPKEKSNRRVVFSRLIDDGVIERTSKASVFRKVLSDHTDLNYVDVDEDDRYESFEFPFKEEQLFKLMPKNIVIIAAPPDAGKTAYCLNLAKLNQNDFKVDYYSSEMGPLEFKSRLTKFPDIELHQWKFRAFERSENFHDVIDPTAVSIIDYLEMHDNFYEVGGLIKKIFDKLTTGVAIICIQKNPGSPNPLGGRAARDKARLVLNLENEFPGHYVKITKAKNWRTPENPNGLYKYYRLHDGCQFSPDEEWRREYE